MKKEALSFSQRLMWPCWQTSLLPYPFVLSTCTCWHTNTCVRVPARAFEDFLVCPMIHLFQGFLLPLAMCVIEPPKIVFSRLHGCPFRVSLKSGSFLPFLPPWPMRPINKFFSKVVLTPSLQPSCIINLQRLYRKCQANHFFYSSIIVFTIALT